MQSIRSYFFTAVGIALTLMAVVFTASLGLALAAIASIVLIGTAVAARITPKPVRATVRTDAARRQREPRIWNDGRGTIIDL